MYYSRCAALVRQQSGAFDAKAYANFARTIMAAWPESGAAKNTGDLEKHEDGRRPSVILVLGVPRSGTTLVERMLSAHSLCCSAGENKALWLVSKYLGAPNADARRKLQDAAMAAKRASWYQDMLIERAGRRGIVVDKSLRNEMRLGLILSMLPDARVIWCRRNPADTAWSCYRTRFAEGNIWSNDFGDIADFMTVYEGLMRHWQKLFGSRFYELDFESFVRNSQKEVRALLSFCHLPDEPVEQRFFQQKTPVSTASLYQVRQAVNTAGCGAWKRYEPYLQPMIQHLCARGFHV